MLERTGVLIEDEHALARLARRRPPRRRGDEPRALPAHGRGEGARDGTLRASRSTTATARRYATLEGDHVHFVPASSALRILDRQHPGGARAEHRRLRRVREARRRAQEHRLPLDRLHPQGHPAGHRRRLAALPGARALEAADRLRAPSPPGACRAWARSWRCFRERQGRPGEEADGDLHLLPEHAAALGRGPDREHHGLRGVGHPHRDRARAAARDDLARRPRSARSCCTRPRCSRGSPSRRSCGPVRRCSSAARRRPSTCSS